jgi:hypothetical protein
MAGSFVKNNGTVTITFEYTTLVAKAQAVVDNVIEELYDRGYRGGWPLGSNQERKGPTDLANGEKVTIMDAYLKSVIVNMARARDRAEREQTARDAAATASGDIDL